MAKDQGLSLNPTKISGACGRLMCCLSYEQCGYEEKIKRVPKVGSLVSTPMGEGTVVAAHILKEEVSKENLDGVILPGGMPGTLNLQKDLFVEEMVLYANENKKLVAAICAAPMILGELGVLEDKMATCYPGFETHFCGGRYTGELVQVCENVIKGKGAGAALFFGAEIVEYFKPQLGKELLEEMQCFAD